MEVRVSWGPWGIWEPAGEWRRGGKKKKGARCGLKRADLGVE